MHSQEKRAPKGKSESPWSLHIRSFWKIRFTNPPEEQGVLLSRSFKGRTMMVTRYQNPQIGSIEK
jgi:hypothetical protein